MAKGKDDKKSVKARRTPAFIMRGFGQSTVPVETSATQRDVSDKKTRKVRTEAR